MADRRLVLVRHAQAGEAPLDRDRPLTEHGRQQAEAVGAWLAEVGVTPDRVLVSPALRARQTWERAAAGLGAVPEPVIEDRIYDNTVDALIELVREAPEAVPTLVVVGHNPSIGALTHALDDGEGPPDVVDLANRGFPAGGVAVFAVPASFAGLDEGGATLTHFSAPGA